MTASNTASSKSGGAPGAASETGAWGISFHDLTVGYGDFVVLSGISATLPPGKISMIIGGSGCGKSTLLRHIIGLQRPISGRVSIGGRDLFTVPESEFRRIRRHMGVLFQDGALLGSLSLADNVALPLAEHLRLPGKLVREAGLEVLGLVGLADFADYYPNQLSGGMRKRAGLARAIIAEPRVLLCDEPTSGLDPITAARMDSLMLAMHRQYPEMTCVVVSHDLRSLQTIADYVLVLNDRKAIFQGTLAELRKSEDPYIREFLDRQPPRENLDLARRRNPIVSEALDKWLES